MSFIALLLVASLHDDAEFAAVTERYRNMEYEQVILTCERLAVRPGLSPVERAEILLWMALSYEGVGDGTSAERMMREALSRDVAATLPVKSSPAIAARLEELRAEERARPKPAEEAPARPAPIPAPVPEAPLPVLPIATGSGAAIALAGTGVLAWLAADRYGAAQDQTRFADERQVSYGEHVAALGGAVALGVVGVGLGATAGLLLVTRSEP